MWSGDLHLTYTDMEPYAMAYLNGGKILAVNSAIANLANRHLLKIDSKEKKLQTTKPAMAG